MKAAIQKWGNSLGFRIPALWAKENGIQNGSEVEMIIESNKITILPSKKTLEEMVESITDENLHSEIASGNAVGKEEW